MTNITNHNFTNGAGKVATIQGQPIYSGMTVSAFGQSFIVTGCRPVGIGFRVKAADGSKKEHEFRTKELSLVDTTSPVISNNEADRLPAVVVNQKTDEKPTHSDHRVMKTQEEWFDKCIECGMSVYVDGKVLKAKTAKGVVAASSHGNNHFIASQFIIPVQTPVERSDFVMLLGTSSLANVQHFLTLGMGFRHLQIDENVLNWQILAVIDNTNTVEFNAALGAVRWVTTQPESIEKLRTKLNDIKIFEVVDTETSNCVGVKFPMPEPSNIMDTGKSSVPVKKVANAKKAGLKDCGDEIAVALRSAVDLATLGQVIDGLQSSELKQHFDAYKANPKMSFGLIKMNMGIRIRSAVKKGSINITAK